MAGCEHSILIYLQRHFSSDKHMCQAYADVNIDPSVCLICSSLKVTSIPGMQAVMEVSLYTEVHGRTAKSSSKPSIWAALRAEVSLLRAVSGSDPVCEGLESLEAPWKGKKILFGVAEMKRKFSGRQHGGLALLPCCPESRQKAAVCC